MKFDESSCTSHIRDCIPPSILTEGAKENESKGGTRAMIGLLSVEETTPSPHSAHKFLPRLNHLQADISKPKNVLAC